ncbi:MAG: EAL domain-containing response regulator [Alphaproteobacteria bacterium]|nr:EAL domain-containing response regulator [Alphaproteobacteria bacterium]
MGGQLTLLAVDDEPGILGIVEDVAESMGFSVRTGGNGAEFWEHFTVAAPDVIMLDLVMPDCDGVEVLRRLASLGARSKIILMSGMDDRTLRSAERIAANLELEIAGYLRKPFSVTSLRELLGKGTGSPANIVDAQRLAEGIKKGELVNYYQPKIVLPNRQKTASVMGVEVLSRWNHPHIGLLGPDRYISIAEESGSILALTLEMIQRLIVDMKGWHEAGHQISAAVNLSPELLTDISLPDQISAILIEGGISPSYLTLELTETGAMQDVPLSMDILTRFRLKGVQLSIDDFGTGYSSLIQLYRMPFGELKVDRSFVHSLPEDDEAAHIVRSIVDLAHNLGLTVCAEGVETQTAYDYLTKIGCDSAQGYFISPPVPPGEFSRFLGRSLDLNRREAS